TGRLRREHERELYDEIVPWMLERPKFEAMHALAEAGVAASAVYDTADLFRDPHLRERGFIQQVDHPVEGPVTLFGSPLRLSESQVPLTPAPSLGEHTTEVLCADLGLTPEEVEALRGDRAIA